jgi:hypothetical protein
MNKPTRTNVVEGRESEVRSKDPCKKPYARPELGTHGKVESLTQQQNGTHPSGPILNP